MKKKLLFLIPILLLLCFSSPASAMSTEEGTGVDDLGLFTYAQRFSDLSGALIVTTTAVNNSGIMKAYVTTTVICMNASRNFRLRIYDSDEKRFIETNNENGIGEKERRITVRTHPDTETLLWTAFVTDLTAEIFYAQISLYYIYDEEAEDLAGKKDEDDSISQAEYEAERKRLMILAWSWSAQAIFGSIIAIFLAKKLANRFWGCG